MDSGCRYFQVDNIKKCQIPMRDVKHVWWFPSHCDYFFAAIRPASNTRFWHCDTLIVDKLLKISVWGGLSRYFVLLSKIMQMQPAARSWQQVYIPRPYAWKSLVYSEGMVYIKSYPGSSYGKACKVLNKFCAQIDNEEADDLGFWKMKLYLSIHHSSRNLDPNLVFPFSILHLGLKVYMNFLKYIDI